MLPLLSATATCLPSSTQAPRADRECPPQAGLGLGRGRTVLSRMEAPGSLGHFSGLLLGEGLVPALTAAFLPRDVCADRTRAAG